MLNVSQDRRKKLAELGLHAILKMVFNDNYIHAGILDAKFYLLFSSMRTDNVRSIYLFFFLLKIFIQEIS
jgi:hypothetical protein